MDDRDEPGVTGGRPSAIVTVGEIIRDGLIVLDESRRIRHVNRVAHEQLGRRQRELVGADLLVVVPGLTDTGLGDVIDAVRADGVERLVEAYLPAFGGWYAAGVSRVDDDVVLVVREVTGHRRVARQRSLVSALAEAIPMDSDLQVLLRSVIGVLRHELGGTLAEAWIRMDDDAPLRLVVTDHETGLSDALAPSEDGAGEPGCGVHAALRGTDAVVTDLAGSLEGRDRAAMADGLRTAIHLAIEVGDRRRVVIGLLSGPGGHAEDAAELLAEVRPHLAIVVARHLAQLEMARLFDLGDEMVAVLSLGGRYRRVNNAMAQTLGYAAEDLLAIVPEQLLHPDDLRRTRHALADLIRTGESTVGLENRVRHRNGTYRWISWNAHVDRDQQLVYSTGRDVTASRVERRFQDRLNSVLTSIAAGVPVKVSLAHLVFVIEHLEPGVVGTVMLHDASRNAVVVAAGPSMPPSFLEAIDGLEVGPSVGSCGTAIHRGETVLVADIATDPLWDGYREMVAPTGFRASWSMPIVAADGEVLGAFALYSREVGLPSPFVVSLVDRAVYVARIAIQRHRAELARTESDERLRLLAEVTTDAIWDWDVRRDEFWRSDGFEQLFGLPPVPPGQPFDLTFPGVHPDDASRVADGFDRALTGDATVWSDDYRFRRGDGSYADVTARGTIVRNDAGAPMRVVGSMADLTERRELERQYLRVQRVESLGTLAGGIAHDLNNTLAPIVLAAELLSDAELPDGLDAVVDTIASSARRGSDMVRQILTYARGVEGERRVIDVEPLVGEVGRILADTIPKDIEVRLDLDGVGREVRGDPTQLHQVVVNLAVNARDAMPDGGRLDIAVDEVVLGPDDPGRLGVMLQPGAYVRIAVSDTGVGIPTPAMQRLFEPFFSTKPRAEGTGLGLPTSLAIVRSHGGAIGVASTVGEGSVFTVYLLAVNAADRPVAGPTVRTDPMPGATTTLLVVDDEPIVRSVVAEVLRGFGHEVIEAGDGPTALARFVERRHDIALVLTDVMMPGTDGAELTVSLRRLAPDVRVIAMTGLHDDRYRTRLDEAGVVAVLSKPFDREQILTAVDDALRG